MHTEPTESINERSFDFLMIQYQVLSDQQLSHNSLVWSTPSLLFVAQTFLWSIALDNSVEIIIRCILSAISVVIGFASIQSFSRNRLMEISDCIQLRSIEKIVEETCKSKIVLHSHCQLEKRNSIVGGNSCNIASQLATEEFYSKHKLTHKLIDIRTFTVWEIVLWIFFLFSVFLLAYNILS